MNESRSVLLLALLVERYGPDAELHDQGVPMSATLELNAEETDAIKRMFYGEINDATTGLRWVAKEQIDEWRRGQIYLLVVSVADGLWGTLVKSTWEGESDDLAGRDRVTLEPVRAVQSVAYSLAAEVSA